MEISFPIRPSSNAERKIRSELINTSILCPIWFLSSYVEKHSYFLRLHQITILGYVKFWPGEIVIWHLDLPDIFFKHSFAKIFKGMMSILKRNLM